MYIKPFMWSIAVKRERIYKFREFNKERDRLERVLCVSLALIVVY